MFEKAGLHLAKEIKIDLPCQRLEIFYNPELYLSKKGRDQDSMWSLYTPEELEKALAVLGDLVKNNKFEEWLEAHNDKATKERGFSTHFILHKTE